MAKKTLTWQPAKFPELLEDNYKAFTKEIEPIMRSGMSTIRKKAGSNIASTGGVYTGDAIKSLGDLTQMYGKMAFRVGGADVSLNIQEWGRKKGSARPPVSIIQEWMIGKGIGSDLHEAIFIADVIGRRGIKATKPILKAFNEEKDNIMSRVQNSINGVIKNLGFRR